MKTKLFLPILLPGLVLLGLLTFALKSSPVQAAGFVVEANFDDSLAHDATPGDGICADETGLCTLRAAIEEANALVGTDTITFISPMTITIDAVEGDLPNITDQLIIDASGVWDTANNRPGVTLDGDGQVATGLDIRVNSNEVYGLYIRNFTNDGIDILSSGNSIGDNVSGKRNVISGNGDTGISISGSAAYGNGVFNNYIGVAPDGITAEANYHGVAITDSASETIIGGLQTDEGNLIAGNSHSGVIISGSGTNHNQLYKNTIGGSGALGNGEYGVSVHINASNTIIGMMTGGNSIIGNTSYGIRLDIITGTTYISYNTINGNNSGIVSWGDNLRVNNNSIHDNDGSGVSVVGATGNLIYENSIYDNTGKGIEMLQHANGDIAAPVILTVTQSSISGTACASCTVEIFSDNADEGKVYEGAAVVDSNGEWSRSINLTGPNVTAVAIDASANNSSEFSAPKTISANFAVYLPAIIK